MKILKLFILSFIMINLSVHANELDFKPVGGGKFIYCNNPEGITDDVLLNGKIPSRIMTNENLTPDKYYVYLSHFNYTGNGHPGFDIELDMEMKAVTDSTFTIHKAFFETPQNYAYIKDGVRIMKENDWGLLNVCCNMLGIPMCDIRGDDFYYPEEYRPVTIEIKKGDSVWLSDYLKNYEPVVFGKGVHIQSFIEIEEGMMDFYVGAIKSSGNVKTRNNLPENPKFGEYRWDYTLKGIADTLPEVKTKINYTITDDTMDGEKIPVFLKNQYIPDGHTVTHWYTQLNPQNDIWSKTTAAESDMIVLNYKDDSKLSYYGKDSPSKNDIWIFDTLHSATKNYEEWFFKGNKETYTPNFELTTDTDNHKYACNIGNYGVATTYSMNITNETDKLRYCTLAITAASEIIAYETAADGKRTFAYVKDNTSEKVTDNMLSHAVPPGCTETFEFSIILPVNYNGGIKNELIITDKNIQSVNFMQKKLNAKEYQKADTCLGSPICEIYDLLPNETANKFTSTGYEYVKGKDEMLVRWNAWDGAPNMYFNLWRYMNTVYILDKEYNVTGTFEFPSLPCAMSYNNGYYFINTAQNGMYKSEDGLKWISTNEVLPKYIPYYDIENASEWAVPELEAAWDRKIRLEYKKSGYDFMSGITRLDFCKLASSLVNTNISSEISPFSDTSDINIIRLYSIGVINGYEDATFRPDELITREQAAAILSRLSQHLNPIYEYDDYTFSDSHLISDWAKNDVSYIYHTGIMQGIGENKFDPLGIYSREQSVMTIFRLYNNFNKKE